MVSSRPAIRVDLIIISSRHGLVAEEVNGVVLNARNFLLCLNVLQAEGLVPACREDVEGDLTADGVCQAVVRELGLEGLD